MVRDGNHKTFNHSGSLQVVLELLMELLKNKYWMQQTTKN